MNMQQMNCEGCGQSAPSYDIVNFGSSEKGFKQLCSLCFNAEIAERSGHGNFENIRLEPIWITDCSGEKHQFHLLTRLMGNIVTLNAFELREGNPAGYTFQIIGAPEDDLFLLLGKLVQKIRRSLSVKYLEEDDHHGLQIKDMAVRGRIECGQSETSQVPTVVVDGRELSWNEFGRILTSFDGWQFKLEICDQSDEL